MSRQSTWSDGTIETMAVEFRFAVREFENRQTPPTTLKTLMLDVAAFHGLMNELVYKSRNLPASEKTYISEGFKRAASVIQEKSKRFKPSPKGPIHACINELIAHAQSLVR